MRPEIYKELKGKLPFASKASEPDTLSFKHRGFHKDTDFKYLMLPRLMQDAIKNPGVKQSYFFEENGYEYDQNATWDQETETMSTNMYCPYSSGHHIGSTCGVCGQVD